MAVTITRTQVRGEMLTRVPLLGRRLTADSVQANAITHLAEYERQRAGLTSFEGQYAHRYLQPDPDRWRLITTLNQPTTDGVVNVDGPAYTVGTRSDVAYERLTVHPDDLNFAIAEGQRRQKSLTNIALVRGHDGDMELAGVDYWGGGAVLGGSLAVASTPLKITTDVRTGTQALQVTTSNAVNVLWGEQHRVTPGRTFCYPVIFRCPTLTGSFSVGVRDAQNNVQIGSLQTISGISGGAWLVTWITAQAPTNCNFIQIEFFTNNSGDVYVVDTTFGPYQAGQTEYPLQSAFNEAYKLRFVRPTRFLYPLSTAGFYDADSIEFVGDLTSPEDFQAEVFRRDANSNRLRFVANSYNNRNVGWGLPSAGSGSFMSNNMRPIFLAMEAQVSDFEPLLTEASTTSQPLDECACFALRSLFETLVSREPSNPAWPPLLAEYAAWSAVELVARPPQAMMPPKRLHQIRA